MIYFSKEDIMSKCIGCGAFLQSEESEKEGYIRIQAANKNLCERCFRIRHYGEYKEVAKTNQDFLPILEEINQSDGLVLLVADLFHLKQDYTFFEQHLNKDILLVLTKRDVLPYSVADASLLEHLSLGIHPYDTIIVSSNKKYQLDELLEKIKQYAKEKVYFVGYTNVGKSTLINQILRHYYHSTMEITTSLLPSTTLSTIEITLPQFTLIDTPGFLDTGSLLEKVSAKELKRILPKNEIKPITYQVKGQQTILIDSYACIELKNTNVTLFFSNQLKMERLYHPKSFENLSQTYEFEVKDGEDVVISGLGFLKCTKGTTMNIQTFSGVAVFIRPSLI